MLGASAAAAAENGSTGLCQIDHLLGELLHRKVEASGVVGVGTTGVGLCDEGNLRTDGGAVEAFLQPVGTLGAVDADSGSAQLLKHDNAGGQCCAHQSASCTVNGNGNKDGYAEIARGEQSGAAFPEAEHGLKTDEIDTGVDQSDSLLTVDVNDLVKGSVAIGRNKKSGGGYIAADKDIIAHSIASDLHKSGVELINTTFKAVGSELCAVGTEGGGVNGIRTGSHIAALKLCNDIGVVDYPLLDADTFGKSGGNKMSAGAAVEK